MLQSDTYGGFNSDGKFVTATIPPSYQNCTQEGNLRGCIIKDDDLDEQCNQGRTGKYIAMYYFVQISKLSHKGMKLLLIL